MRNSLIPTALFAIISSVVSLETQAVALNNGDVLTITTGQEIYDPLTGWAIGISSGSYYGVDTNGDNKISQNEKVLLAQGTTGLELIRK